MDKWSMMVSNLSWQASFWIKFKPSHFFFSYRTLFAWCESAHTILWNAITQDCHNACHTHVQVFSGSEKTIDQLVEEGWPLSGWCTSTADQLFHCCHSIPSSDQLSNCCHPIPIPPPTSYLIVAIQSHFLTSWDRSEALEGFRAGFEAAKFSGQMLLRHRWLQYFQFLSLFWVLKKSHNKFSKNSHKST